MPCSREIKGERTLRRTCPNSLWRCRSARLMSSVPLRRNQLLRASARFLLSVRTAQDWCRLSMRTPAAASPSASINVRGRGRAATSALPLWRRRRSSTVSRASSMRTRSPSLPAKLAARAYCKPMGCSWYS